jgi:hypothetical protein
VAIILSVICLKTNDTKYKSTRKKQMTDNIIATERKTNDGQYNSHRKKNK